MRKSTLSLLVLLAATACGRTGEPVEPDSGPQQAMAGDTITLRYGASALLGDHVRIVFRSVESDSRCPVDVQCVWAGDAAIRLDASSGGAWQPFVLHTNLQPRSAEHGGFVVELVGVEPEPRRDRSVDPGDYSVRLAISRG